MEPREVVQRLHDELFVDGNMDAVDELVHPDFFNHEARDDHARGPEGMRGTAEWLKATFGNPTFEAHEWVTEGDMVAFRATFRGTHTGELNGRPATNRQFAVQHFHMWRAQDGKIAEHWACRDDLGLAMQVGLIGPPS